MIYVKRTLCEDIVMTSNGYYPSNDPNWEDEITSDVFMREWKQMAEQCPEYIRHMLCEEFRNPCCMEKRRPHDQEGNRHIYSRFRSGHRRVSANLPALGQDA